MDPLYVPIILTYHSATSFLPSPDPKDSAQKGEIRRITMRSSPRTVPCTRLHTTFIHVNSSIIHRWIVD